MCFQIHFKRKRIRKCTKNPWFLVQLSIGLKCVVVYGLQCVCSLHQLIQKPEILTKSIVCYPRLFLRGQIFDFRDIVFGKVKNIAICLKKYHKSEWHLYLVRHNFTKLSQNMCLIDTHILIYRYSRCDCKLWNVL